MTYTPDPELDAARHDDEAEDREDFNEKAAVEAPKIVLQRLLAMTTMSEWLDRKKFYAGNSANDIVFEALEARCTEVEDEHAYYMIYMSDSARQSLLKAMADWFAGIYAVEIYTEYLEELNADV